MKVAIPEWQGRVSPVFDVARHLRIFEIEAGNAQLIQNLVFNTDTVSERVTRLTNSGVVVLICGAVSAPLESAIRTAGIQVIAQTCGNVDDVAAAYANGHLTGATFLMPGCRRRHHRCRKFKRSGTALFPDTEQEIPESEMEKL